MSAASSGRSRWRPFQVVLVPINAQKSQRVREVADKLYAELTAAGIEVLYDDRDARPGVKFADAELLGIPHRVVVGERGIDAGKLEYRASPRHRKPGVPARQCAGFHLARAWVAEPRARLARAPGAVALGAGTAHADQQKDPELKAIVEHAIAQAECFTDRYESAVWYTMMEPRLRKTVKDQDERLEILKQVFCETRREGEARLPPGLVMAVIQVESRFDRWAVSTAGAVGLMQVMPFWPEQLGMKRLRADARGAEHPMGCAILRFYLKKEKQQRHARARALQRQRRPPYVLRSRAESVDALERRGRSRHDRRQRGSAGAEARRPLSRCDLELRHVDGGDL